MLNYKALAKSDPQAYQLVQQELDRQSQGLELIPSENYVSPAVLEALSTVYTNKYAEGYPQKRYYGGQVNTDQVETLAIERAKKLFGADHANVQAYSGAPANLAVYLAWAKPGDTILAMDLSHGGHLTHGAPVTEAAKLFKFVHYGMSNVQTGEIDYESVHKLAKKHRPKILVGGFSSYPRKLNWTKLAEIARGVGALPMADVAHIAGLIAGGVEQNPLEHGFLVATSTTHKTLRGPRGGLILSHGQVGNPLKPVEHKLENLPTIIDRTVFPGLQGGPHINTILAKAVAFKEANQPEFRQYAQQVVFNAQALAKALEANGFNLVTGGTDNHLVLVDVYSSFKVSGKQAEEALEQIGLTVNKNVIADDPRPAYDPSGIRLGTPAVTTRGLGKPQMQQIAEWITQAIKSDGSVDKLAKIKKQVEKLCHEFPLPS